MAVSATRVPTLQWSSMIGAKAAASQPPGKLLSALSEDPIFLHQVACRGGDYAGQQEGDDRRVPKHLCRNNVAAVTMSTAMP